MGNPVFNRIKRGHVKGEDVYRVLGQTDSGRYLAVFFIYKETHEALVISARDMTTKERKVFGLSEKE
ncbi:MAG: BrnT family toxin [Deltaproteobacteria bacterium]|nr:BrnT family toxin [Deltaproteobacteria bacterium]